MEIIVISAAIGILISLLFIFLIISASYQEKRFVENSKQIGLEMSKEEVIDILGDRYTQSILKNGVEKLEWKWRRCGTSSRVAKGVYVHSGSLTRRITVKFQNGRVIEINSLNMD